MSPRSQRLRAAVISGTVAAAVCIVGLAANAQTGAFAGMAGRWSGGGTVSLAGGPRERLSCRANYAVSGGGASLQQTLRCASESYRFELVSNLQDQGGQLTGSWSETSRNIQGTLSGRGQGGRLQVNANGPGFVANVSLNTQGDRQTVTVTTQGSEAAGASITLSRSK